MQSDGISNLHYLAGDRLLGTDGEGTVDGSHPTDLGFLRQADVFEAALRPTLGDTTDDDTWNGGSNHGHQVTPDVDAAPSTITLLSGR